MVASVGAVVGTSVSRPSTLMSASELTRPRIAVTIGSAIAVAVPFPAAATSSIRMTASVQAWRCSRA